jgi:hypothetical protein
MPLASVLVGWIESDQCTLFLQVGKIGDTPKPLPTFEARVGASGEIEVNV